MSTETAAQTAGSAWPAPLDELLTLHRSDRLVAEYPRLRQLLTDLPPEYYGQAGRLLARLDPEEVAAAHPEVTTIRVAVTGHGVLAALLPPLTAELARHGLLLRPYLADFDSYVFELSDPGSQLYRFGADLTLCVLDPAVVADELPLPWTAADAERVFAEKQRLIDGLVARFTATSGGTLVLNTLPLPHGLAAQLVDYRSRALLAAARHEANARLLRLTAEHPAVVVLDTDTLAAEGIEVTEPRLDVYAKAHLSPELLARYAREVGHLARSITGRAKKCLVLDLDGTVWGGVLGDDGIEGIEVAESHRGEAFQAFQRAVKQVGSQGVLLAAVSKNDTEPVRAVLTGHRGMTLREDDFTSVTANWHPKHENIRHLAEALNLGLDSLVFVDDSPYERGLIRRELPEVTVVPVGPEPAHHVAALLRDGWFNVRELTEADRGRSAQYREELVRRDFLDRFDSIEDYLRELGVRVRLAQAAEDDVPRVSQITLRTNQFNLTTERLQQPDVLSRLKDPDHRVLTIRSADRFGDNGLVGVLFTRREGDVVHIDNFLLSCRVFSRGIEQACLSAVLRRARDDGAVAVIGRYRSSPKNDKVADLYPQAGFTADDDPGDHDGQTAVFRHDLTAIAAPPEYVLLTESLGGDSL